MFDEVLFRKDPRGYAIDLVEQGLVSPQLLLEACLSYMSTDDVRGMLDANELSPRFEEQDEDEEPDCYEQERTSLYR